MLSWLRVLITTQLSSEVCAKLDVATLNLKKKKSNNRNLTGRKRKQVSKDSTNIQFPSSKRTSEWIEEDIGTLKRQMEFILGVTKTGLDIIDSEFNVRYIDPEWAKVYGEPDGKRCYQYFMDRDGVCPGCGIPKALETKTITVSEEMLVKEGDRPIQVTTIPFQSTNGEWLVAEVNVDISERKRAEEALRKAHDDLEIRVRERTAELANAVEALQVDITERQRAEEALRRSEETAKRLAQENAIIAEIGRIINSSLNIEEVYEQFAEVVRKLIPFEGIAINIINHKESVLTVPYVSGKGAPGCQPGDILPLEGSVTGEVIRKRSGLTIQTENRDALQDRYPTLLTAFDAGLRSVMVVPLISKDQVTGTIHFRSAKLNAYSEQDLKLAESVASQIAGAIANVQLFTEHKQTEKALRSERDKFRGMLLALNDGVDIVNEDYIIEFQNELLRERFGDKVGEKCYAAYRGLGEPRHFCSIQEAIRTGSATRVELVGKDGRNYELNSSPFRDVDGEVKVIELVRDITEHKQAEQALKESQEKFRFLAEKMADIVWTVDLNFRTTYVSPSIEKVLGFTPEEREKQSLEQMITPESLTRVQRMFLELQREENGVSDPDRSFTIEVEYYRKDGSTVWMENTVKAMRDATGTLIGIYGVSRDITERKQAEEALKRSEETAKRVGKENAVMAEIGRIISSTLNIEEVYERFAEEVRRIIPFDRIAINTINPKDSTLTITYATGIEVPDRCVGRVIPLAGTLTEEIKHSRSRLLVQIEKEIELTGHFPNLLPSFQVGLRSYMSTPLISKYQVIGVLHLRSVKPNAYSELDLTLAERVANQIAGAIANAQIFSERVRSEEEKIALQEQLRQSQKMEAIGQLAGGIAHDFNNLLTIIKGYSQLSLLDLNENDPLWGNIQEIQKATQRATDLTRQLLAFSRRQILDLKVLDVNALLKDLGKLLRRIIGEDIELVTLLAEDLGRTKIDPGQFEQMILNLAVNARDAMPSGGKLIIETANVLLDEEYAHTHIGVTPGHYVRLSISDTGIGMPQEIREKAFEPFFTTKEIGRGTGLGLSTVYGIVKQSGGNTWVYSEPGHGTTFKIYLPRVEQELDTFQRPDETDSLPRGSETVLLVEDEPLVRGLALRLLTQQGYGVLEASNGEEALRVAQEHAGEPIHLLLTDVVMPRMSGKELADHLKSLRPGIKVLYVSGYTDNAIVHHGVLDPDTHFLQKPFSHRTLSHKVREVLDR